MAIDYSQFTKTSTGNIGPDGKPIYDIFNQGVKMSYEQALPLFKSGLNVDQITPTTPLALPAQKPQDNTAGAIVAGAGAYMKELDTFLNPPSADKTKEDTLTTEIDKYLGESTGRGQEQLNTEANLGIPETKKQLADVNGEIARKTAEYNALLVKNESQPILGSIVQGQQANIAKFAAADIGILQATALGLQGKLEAAQESANRAVDLKYQDKQDLINTKLKQLELIKSRLAGSEKTRATALELALNDQKDKLAVEISNQKDKNQTLLNLLQSYPDAGISLTDTLESAARKIATVSKLYRDQLSTGGGGGTVTERQDALLKQAKQQALTKLEASKGTDGFVDPGVYQKLRLDYGVAFDKDPAEFDLIFGSMLRVPPRQL